LINVEANREDEDRVACSSGRENKINFLLFTSGLGKKKERSGFIAGTVSRHFSFPLEALKAVTVFSFLVREKTGWF
jgi:hypothetical protein